METGAIERFKAVGQFTSYCRCVGSQRLSNGNKYLAWAFIEAVNFAIRFNEQAKRNRIVALKAVAHKLARASFYVIRDQVPFDAVKLFS